MHISFSFGYQKKMAVCISPIAFKYFAIPFKLNDPLNDMMCSTALFEISCLTLLFIATTLKGVFGLAFNK